MNTVTDIDNDTWEYKDGKMIITNADSSSNRIAKKLGLPPLSFTCTDYEDGLRVLRVFGYLENE